MTKVRFRHVVAVLMPVFAAGAVAADKGAQVVDVAIGPPGQVCALQSSGTVWCWGTGILNAQQSDSSEPRVVPGLSNIAKIAVGSFASCALGHGGEVSCWGTNLQQKTVSATPFPVTGIPPVADIAIGFRHMCARTVAGDVYCWGANPAGELGNDSTTDNFQPAKVPDADHAVSIDAGVNNTCMVNAAGAVKCWGTDNQSRVADGRGFAIYSRRPVPLTYLKNMVSVHNGRNYACGRDRRGAIFCWGSLGAVPQGATPILTAPLGADVNRLGGVVRLDHAERAVALELAMFQGCAAYEGGSVRCWTFMRPPHEIANIPGVTKIALNDEGLGCLLVQDGHLQCWDKDSSTPREVTLVSE